MEYQKIENLQDNKTTQPSKSTTKNCVEMNDDSRGTNSQIQFKNSMLKSNLCNCSDSYILIRGTIFVANTSAGVTDTKNDNLTMFLIIEEAKETIL